MSFRRKSIVTYTGAALLTSLLVGAAPAMADSYEYRRDFDRFDRSHVKSDRHRDRRPISVDLDVRTDGTARIPLRRLLETQHGIDTDRWQIREVSISNKERYGACAELRIGDRATGPVDLRRGTTRIRAPRGYGDGRWTLMTENARVRDIDVVLEPRNSYAYERNPRDRRYDRRYDRDWEVIGGRYGYWNDRLQRRLGTTLSFRF
ncbi:MAG: hypothetical protein AAF515_13995 [Pseudomonadota bacterium]